VWLEIGFGNGDNLLANAKNIPDILFIGAEIHQPGVGTVLRQMEREIGLDKEVDLSTQQHQNDTPPPCNNMRVLPGDGIKLLSLLPNNYLDTLLITFPDPWPKKSHTQWRVVQRETVKQMRRVLKDGGRVFVVTDADFFSDWTRHIFTLESSVGDTNDGKDTTHWKEVVHPKREEWLPVVSYYEQKGINEGRYSMTQCWQVCKRK
jgi:tRNA (guanine-N7-)-methyltransferase